MFVVEALYPFSKEVINPASQTKKAKQNQLEIKQKQDEAQENAIKSFKRQRSPSHEKQFKRQEQLQKQQENSEKNQQEITYLSFDKGDKILVQQAYQTGWWYGHCLSQPTIKGFFPSNYVQVGAKPPPPPQPEEPEQQEQEQQSEQIGQDGQWARAQIQAVESEKRPLTSDYYQGIKSYKYVKITDSNKHILNGNYVKFDVATGLAKIPIKDQAPDAKAVRQMGYYFDYHQWNQQRNRNPEAFRNKPDPKRKKKHKKLRLLCMGKEA